MQTQIKLVNLLITVKALYGLKVNRLNVPVKPSAGTKILLIEFALRLTSLTLSRAAMLLTSGRPMSTHGVTKALALEIANGPTRVPHVIAHITWVC